MNNFYKNRTNFRKKERDFIFQIVVYVKKDKTALSALSS